MTEYAFHPIADRFPLLPEAELAALAADIKRNGLQEPIKLMDGQIIDGRNRYNACVFAGVEPVFESVSFKNDRGLAQFIVSNNVMRRHLSQSQRAYMGVEMVGWGKAAERDQSRLHLPKISDVEEMLGVSAANLNFARKVREKGTDEDRTAALAGTKRVDEIAAEIARREKAESKAKAKTRAKELSAEAEYAWEKFVNGEIKQTTLDDKVAKIGAAYVQYVDRLPKLEVEEKEKLLPLLDLGQASTELVENDVAPTVEEETAKQIGKEHMEAMTRAMKDFGTVVITEDELIANADLKRFVTFYEELQDHAANVTTLLDTCQALLPDA